MKVSAGAPPKLSNVDPKVAPVAGHAARCRFAPEDAVEKLPRNHFAEGSDEPDPATDSWWTRLLWATRGPKATSAVMIGAAGATLFAGVPAVVGAPLPSASSDTDATGELHTTAPSDVELEAVPSVALERPEILDPRAPRLITLGNPLTDSSTHAATYSLLPAAVGFGLDQLAVRHPEVNRHFALRLLELSATTAAEIPWMVLSHEAGHYRVANSYGWNPRIEMTGFASGLTHYDIPEGERDLDTKRIISAAGGTNQEELNALHMYSNWARNGGARYHEATAYLLAQTNQALYSLRSTMLGADAASSDDMANYASLMTARGHRITTAQLAAIGLATDLLSAPFWATIAGDVKFLASGDRVVEMPGVDLGGTRVTFPSFHTLLTTDGPVVGGRLLVGSNRRVPVEVGVDARVDGSALALGAKLYDLPLADRVFINPYLRFTAPTDGDPAGVLVGSDVRLDVHSRLSIIGTAEYRVNDLLSEAEGAKDGFNVRLHLGVRF